MSEFGLSSASLVLSLCACLLVTATSAAIPNCHSSSHYIQSARLGREGGHCFSIDWCYPGHECCRTNSNIKICQRKDTSCPPKDDRCESGYVLSTASGSKCVKLQEGKVSYTDSIFHCLKQGMGPLTLKSEEEVRQLHRIRRCNTDYNVPLWLAGQFHQTTDPISWVTEFYSLTEPNSFTYWSPSEPSCTIYDSCHMISQTDGLWSMVKVDGTETHHQYFACELLL